MFSQKVKELYQLVQAKELENAKRTSERDYLLKERLNLEEQIQNLNIDTLNECVDVLRKMSTYQRETARSRLEELGTMALQYSLGPDYEMRIEITESRKKPQAEVYVLHLPTLLKTDPMEENGGGVIDILSVAMRFVIIQSHVDPVIEGPIILDEPFKMVSEEYIPMLVEFVQKIASDFGRQVILITHNTYLAQTCPDIIRVAKNKDDESVCAEIDNQSVVEEES